MWCFSCFSVLQHFVYFLCVVSLLLFMFCAVLFSFLLLCLVSIGFFCNLVVIALRC